MISKTLFILTAVLGLTMSAEADPLIYDTNGNAVGHVRKYGEQPEIDEQPELQNSPSLSDPVIELNQPRSVQPRYTGPSYAQMVELARQRQSAYWQNAGELFRRNWMTCTKWVKTVTYLEVPLLREAISGNQWAAAAYLYNEHDMQTRAYQAKYHRNPPDVEAAWRKAGPPDAETKRRMMSAAGR
jgi:hypothetical protein